MIVNNVGVFIYLIIIIIIRRRRLTWLDHVARMSNDRRAKQVLNWVPGKRWKEDDQGRTNQRPSSEKT